MTKKPSNNPFGKPPFPIINAPIDGKVPSKVIDFNQVVYWAEMQATQEEVAGSFRVCVETLNSRLQETIGMSYSDLRKRVDGMAKMSVRRFQFKQAEKSPVMAIWLGKVWLGQRDTDSEKEKTAEVNPYLDTLHQILLENAKLKEMNRALECKANSELPGSDAQIQHLGGSCPVGQDACEFTEANRET